MRARELFQAGKLDEAIEALGVELRDNPTDAQRRTFLFELLCFAGNYARAEKQLDVLAQGGPQAEMGALVYRSALHAERTRQEMFRTQSYPQTVSPSTAISGTLNGEPFQSLVDADPRIGARFELFAAGQYMWIPFEHIASIRMAPPTRLRDLLWSPASVRTGPGFRGLELGEVLLPVLAPLSWQHPDGAVRLGRATEWQELANGSQAPIGQRLLLVDDNEFPILELRELEIAPVPATAS
jgi:type VI secretion system protein ImpE